MKRDLFLMGASDKVWGLWVTPHLCGSTPVKLVPPSSPITHNQPLIIVGDKGADPWRHRCAG